MYQEPQRICRADVCRIKLFRAKLGKFGTMSFVPLENCLLLHLCYEIYHALNLVGIHEK